MCGSPRRTACSSATRRSSLPVTSCLPSVPRRQAGSRSAMGHPSAANHPEEVAVRILDIREKTVSIASPIANAYIDFSKMTCSVVAVVTDVVRDGKPVVGYRFIARVLEADPETLIDRENDNLDPFAIWKTLMTNEKPGGHGERSVAVGTIDMAVWDAVAKIAGKPLFRLLAERSGREANTRIFVYAAGGYYYP